MRWLVVLCIPDQSCKKLDSFVRLDVASKLLGRCFSLAEIEFTTIIIVRSSKTMPVFSFFPVIICSAFGKTMLLGKQNRQSWIHPGRGNKPLSLSQGRHRRESD